jgi:hypothetical protein
MMTRHTVLSAMVFMSLLRLPVGSVQAAPVLFASGVAEGSSSSGCQPTTQNDSGLGPVSVLGGCGGLGSGFFHGFVNPTPVPEIGASAQIDISQQLVGPGGVHVRVDAGYVDSVVLTGGTTFHTEWDIAGQATTECDGIGGIFCGNDFVGFRFRADVFTGLTASGRVGNTVFYDDHIMVDFSSPTGVPIVLQPELVINLQETVPTGDMGSIHVLYDLTHTFRLVVAEVRDAEGHVVPGATVTSALGIDYFGLASPTPVPAPASGLLVAAGLACLALARHSRCRWRRGPHRGSARATRPAGVA